jgi:hypothetical protein
LILPKIDGRIMNNVHYEGFKLSPIWKPFLKPFGKARNRRIKTTSSLRLIEQPIEAQENITYFIHADTQGAVIDNPSDFTLHRIDRIWIEKEKSSSEKDGYLFVVFEGILAKVPKRIVEFID